jgi:hypothetical protein
MASSHVTAVALHRQRLARIEALQQRKAAARAAAAGAPPGAVTISEEAGPSGGGSSSATAAAASTADPAGGSLTAQGGDAAMPAVDLEPEALVSVDAIVAAAAQQQAQVGRTFLPSCQCCRQLAGLVPPPSPTVRLE